MKCKYEVKNIFPVSLSDDDMKKEICRKIARVIFFEENIEKRCQTNNCMLQ